MSQSIPRVECKRESHRSLRRDLSSDWPSRNTGNQRGGGEAGANQWSKEVGEAEYVETAGEGDAGDTVEGGADPGYLWAVDGQMWGCWTLLALLDEDVVGVCWGDLLSCEVSVACVSYSRRS